MAIQCLANFDTCAFGEVKPEEGDVLSPWVRVTLTKSQGEVTGGGGTITVGNESAPNNRYPHTACIKDFEFGKSNGFEIRIVIQDEQGGSFVDFAEALLKDYRCNVAPMFMSVEYGWVKSICAANASPINATRVYGNVTNLETNFEGGRFQYEITSKDVMTVGQEGYVDLSIGGDGDEGVYYTDAVRQLLTSDPPPIIGSVNWYKNDTSGNLVQVEEGEKLFHSPNNDPIEEIKGPKRKWQCNGMDKLDVIYRWTSMVESNDRKKGFTFYLNNEDENLELQIWEDPKPACGELSQAQCIASYIVNGGKESPVISFNPTVAWNFENLTSGGGGIGTSSTDPTDNEGKTKGRECPTLGRASNPGAGHTTTMVDVEPFIDESGQRALEELQKSNDKFFRALDHAKGFQADLVVIGDPRLRPRFLINRFISVIFVNPYFLNGPQSSTYGDCPEWLVAPPCNPVLSNDRYQVLGVTHKIQAGSYTTTLRLNLAKPGLDIGSNERLGGSQLGWKPPPGCPQAT